MDEDIVFSQQQHIGLITLQRPQTLNALTLPMIISLQQQLQRWQEDKSVHAVVIQAAPGKAFCAGGDVRWLYDERDHHAQQMQFFWHEYRLNHCIHYFDKPYIALMDGVTMGGGVGISLHGSHPVASEQFVFAMPETSIGFFPDIGASYLLSRCPGQFGIYLGLTGNRLGAGEALQLGLVKKIVASNKFPELLESLITADLSKNAHAVVDTCLQQVAMPPQPAPIMELQDVINKCFNQHDVEGIIASLDKDENDWAIETSRTLLNKAPLSLKVTLEQLQKAKFLNMVDCIKMDYCLVGHFMQDHDFYEGVRALLIDKDKNPQWAFPALKDVTSAQVADYFEYEQPELVLTV